jgi:hypothetical protein
MIGAISRWIERRGRIRAAWKEDATMLLEQFGEDAYYTAQRLAARSRFRGDRDGFWHWAKVAAEVARSSPHVEMEMVVVERIVEEERKGHIG